MQKMKLSLLVICLIQSSFIFAQQEQIYARRIAVWLDKKISVSWENPTEENRHGRELVRQAIKETWEKYSVVEFTGWDATSESNNTDIRIYIEDDGPHTKGLGKELKNKSKGMVLNFTFKNWSHSCRQDMDFCIKAIAVHEFGHALGFAHEQNRQDCKFDNCFNKEQGSNGDWYVTACDLRSIMNYCNPSWNNDGFLSDLDIQGVQHLYGRPTDNANINPGLQLVHTSNQTGPIKGKSISHIFNIYISGSDAELSDIEKVVYHLHPTFKKKNMESTDRQNKFSIGITVWGQFKASADIYKKGSEKPVTLERYLDFRGTGIQPLLDSENKKY